VRSIAQTPDGYLWLGTEFVKNGGQGRNQTPRRVLITRKLLILRSAEGLKGPTLPGRRYKIGTKIHSINHRFSSQQENTQMPL
jgi:hypothetical protein